MEAKSFVMPPMHDAARRCRGRASPPRRTRSPGTLHVGGQEHFYLEGQVAYAMPGEDDDMLVHCSTQHPSEMQHMVAHVLGLPNHAVTVEMRRMGGGFGGKESQSALSRPPRRWPRKLTGRPAKLRLDRDDDMIVTGKRHAFRIDYEVGFDDDGRILRRRVEHGVALRLFGRPLRRRSPTAPCSTPTTPTICRPSISSRYRCKTNTQSEHRLPRLRRAAGHDRRSSASSTRSRVTLGRDPLDVRQRNFYGRRRRRATSRPTARRSRTTSSTELVDELEERSRLPRAGAQAIARLQRDEPDPEARHRPDAGEIRHLLHRHHLNQAGALVHVYTDGSVQAEPRRHRDGPGPQHQGRAGGRRRVAGRHRPRARSPPPTPARCPTPRPPPPPPARDLNGMAAQDAARRSSARLVAFLRRAAPSVEQSDVVFLPNRVRIERARDAAFAEAGARGLPRAAFSCGPPASTPRPSIH